VRLKAEVIAALIAVREPEAFFRAKARGMVSLLPGRGKKKLGAATYGQSVEQLVSGRRMQAM
jgi:hypothetical protein